MIRTDQSLADAIEFSKTVSDCKTNLNRFCRDDGRLSGRLQVPTDSAVDAALTMSPLAFINHADDLFGCGVTSGSQRSVLGTLAGTVIRCGRLGLTGGYDRRCGS